MLAAVVEAHGFSRPPLGAQLAATCTATMTVQVWSL